MADEKDDCATNEVLADSLEIGSPPLWVPGSPGQCPLEWSKLYWHQPEPQLERLIKTMLFHTPDFAIRRDQRGNTALHLAVENRARRRVVIALLNANREAANIANQDGWRYSFYFL